MLQSPVSQKRIHKHDLNAAILTDVEQNLQARISGFCFCAGVQRTGNKRLFAQASSFVATSYVLQWKQVCGVKSRILNAFVDYLIVAYRQLQGLSRDPWRGANGHIAKPSPSVVPLDLYSIRAVNVNVSCEGSRGRIKRSDKQVNRCVLCVTRARAKIVFNESWQRIHWQYEAYKNVVWCRHQSESKHRPRTDPAGITTRPAMQHRMMCRHLPVCILRREEVLYSRRDV